MDLGIVYHIEDAHQFWAELEDILSISASSSLTRLDSTLQQFVSFCASFHQQYLQTPVQLEHACTLLLSSEIFSYHSDRLSSLVISDALTNTDPHAQLILLHILLLYGRSHSSFFRAQRRWTELIPFLMDHITLVDVDLDLGLLTAGSSNAGRGGPMPIEARLRQLAVMILYEVCRVQRFEKTRLEVFGDEFVDCLFEIVESTRDVQDETLNYCVIKLIIALNEQFMVAAVPPNKEQAKEHAVAENTVIRVLMRRLGSSKTFGENLIFMLNRADGSAEDRCMQLLVLKILYILFTTPGTQEYFYTNDLCVLVDVFIRELDDLDDSHESLRHTYLRVLHPLLTHTQLRTISYKRPQILHTLDSLVAHAQIRDVSPTTKRLVERCLSGEWAVQLKKERDVIASKSRAMSDGDGRGPASPSEGSVSDMSSPELVSAADAVKKNKAPHPLKDLKFSKSMDVLTLKSPRERERERDFHWPVAKSVADDGGHPTTNGHYHHHHHHQRNVSGPSGKPDRSKRLLVTPDNRRGSNDSSLSLVSVAGAGTFPSISTSPHRSSTSPPPPLSPSPLTSSPPLRPTTSSTPQTHSQRQYSASTSSLPPIPATPIFEDPPELLVIDPNSKPTIMATRRRPAPAPPVRRKPAPAVPSRSGKPLYKTGGAAVGETTIATVGKSPLGRY